MKELKQVAIVLTMIVIAMMGFVGCKQFSDGPENPTAPANDGIAEPANFSATDDGAINYGYGIAYKEGSGYFLLNVPAGDFLMIYTTDLGSFPTLIRAFNDSLMTLYLTEGDILREVVIYEGIIGAGRASAAAPQNFAVHSGAVLFRHLTWPQYHQIMATFLVMIGPVTGFANSEVVPGEYNEELTGEQVDDTFERKYITMFSGGGHHGALGGRSGADAICSSHATKEFEHIRAFISVNSADEIRDMPQNYGVPTDRPIVGPTGVKIGDNWGDLLDWNID